MAQAVVQRAYGWRASPVAVQGKANTEFLSEGAHALRFGSAELKDRLIKVRNRADRDPELLEEFQDA